MWLGVLRGTETLVVVRLIVLQSLCVWSNPQTQNPYPSLWYFDSWKLETLSCPNLSKTRTIRASFHGLFSTSTPSCVCLSFLKKKNKNWCNYWMLRWIKVEYSSIWTQNLIWAFQLLLIWDCWLLGEVFWFKISSGYYSFW